MEMAPDRISLVFAAIMSQLTLRLIVPLKTMTMLQTIVLLLVYLRSLYSNLIYVSESKVLPLWQAEKQVSRAGRV